MSNPPIMAADSEPEQTAPPMQQLNRSCESCRALKVRCLPDPSLPNQCQRCTRAKRSCVFVAPQRRRPRKRTDSRVAQLEKEMAAMRTMLKDRRLDAVNEDDSDAEREETSDIDFATDPRETQPPTTSSADSLSINTNYPYTTNINHQSEQSPALKSAYGASGDGSSSLNTPSLTQIASSPDSQDRGDVIDRGVVSLDAAEEMVSLYVNHLSEYFPALVLPINTTAAQLRQTKPALFLSILAASAIAVDASLANLLNRELISLYAQRFFFKCEKSLELVQVLLMMNTFYLPPESPTQIQTYQYSHIAATMALEIGIASRRRVPRKPNRGSMASRPAEKFDEQMAEQARAILTCYHFASSVAMRTRRPNMLVYNDWLKECVKLLSRSPIESDRRLAAWFDLQKITDEALASFGLDDTSSMAPLTESRVHSVLRLFDQKMEDWKEDIDPDYLTVPMVLDYHYTVLSVYELGIGEGYRDPDAIKRQYYTLPVPDEDNDPKQPAKPLSAVRVDLTLKWLNAAHGLLDSFLNCDVHTMRKMTNLVYSRVVLGVMVLLKIHFSVQSGAMGAVIDSQTVKAEVYLETMTQRLTEAGGNSKYAIPARWLRVVGGKARDWHRRFQAHHSERETQRETQVHAGGNKSSISPPTSEGLTWQHGGGFVPPEIPGGMSILPRQQQQLQQPHEHHHVIPQQPPFNTPMPYPTTNTTPTAAAAAMLQPGWPQSSSHVGLYALHHHQTAYQLSTATWSQQSIPPTLPPSHSSSFGQNPVDLYPVDTTLPMEMEFEWVPEGNMFQLPTF